VSSLGRDAANGRRPNPCLSQAFSLSFLQLPISVLGKEKPLSSQKPPEPRGLLRILASVFSGALFGWFLSKLNPPIEQSTKTIPSQDSTDDRNAQSNPPLPLTVRIESYPPPSISEETKTEKKEQRFISRGNFIATCLTSILAAGLLIVTCKYVSYTYRTWREMQQQTRILAEAQRPWVMGFPVISKFAFMPDGSGQVWVSWRVDNFGHSPAFGIHIQNEIVLTSPKDKRFENTTVSAIPTDRQKEICEPMRKQPITSDWSAFFTLFPEQSGGTKTTLIQISKEYIQGASYIENREQGPIIDPALVGCFDYTFQAYPVIHHQTGFAYMIVGPSGGIPVGKNPDPKKLAVFDYYIGEYAD